MKTNYIGLIFVLVVFLSSCEKEVKLELPPFEQKIVVDGRIETGMPPIVVLTRSQDLYAPTDFGALQNNFVKNAVITVSNGTTSVLLVEFCTNDLDPALLPFISEALGVSPEILTSINFCAYSSFDPAIFGEVGRTYSLNIDVEGQTYKANTTIVDPPVVDSVYFKLNGEMENHGFGWLIINDNGAVYNTYYLQMRRIHQNSQGEPADNRFLSAFGPVFDDEFFNGLVFDFGFGNRGSFTDSDIPQEFKGYFAVGDTVVVRLAAMDYPVYEFMKIKYVQDSNGGNPFAAPANAQSNIQGGALGVWAGFSPRYDTLACYPQ